MASRKAARSASHCSSRRRISRNCWAHRASASTRSSRASNARVRCASSRRGWWCSRATSCWRSPSVERAEMESMEQFVGTKAVSERHAFDVAALQRHLQRELSGFAGPLRVEQFKGGQSNPTYKLITPEQTYVMRTKPGPAAKLLPSAHAIEREFRVMLALASTDVPVAQMHLLCEDETVIGRAFYVMQFVDGRVLWEQALPGFTAAGRNAIYDEMNR